MFFPIERREAEALQRESVSEKERTFENPSRWFAPIPFIVQQKS